jgi:hypothetical protein
MMSTLKKQRFKLQLKFEVYEMSKRVIAAATFSGLLLVTAPMIGLAEETQESLEMKVEVLQADTYKDKAAALLKGTGKQIAAVYKSVRNVDKRLAKKDKIIDRLRQDLLTAENQNLERDYVKGLTLDRAQSCLAVWDELLNQVEAQ